jgi:peptide/nickel transport system permease protein
MASGAVNAESPSLVGGLGGWPTGRSRGAPRARARLRRLPIIALGVIIAFAAIGPLVWRQSVTHTDVSQALEPPSTSHPMGTDDVGRDVLARFDRGAAISLIVGAIVVLTSTIIGGAIGLFSGTSRQWVDNVLMRLIDTLLAFPPVILAMAVTLGLGLGLVAATLGVTFTVIPYTARLVRSEVLRLRSQAFIEAAVAIGASRPRIMLRHLLPNLSATLLAQGSASFGYAVLAIAGLGFIGLGAQIPTPEWGTMITEGFQYVLTGAWWMGVFPGLGLLVAVSATIALADDVRVVLQRRSVS